MVFFDHNIETVCRNRTRFKQGFEEMDQEFPGVPIRVMSAVETINSPEHIEALLSWDDASSDQARAAGMTQEDLNTRGVTIAFGTTLLGAEDWSTVPLHEQELYPNEREDGIEGNGYRYMYDALAYSDRDLTDIAQFANDHSLRIDPLRWGDDRYPGECKVQAHIIEGRLLIFNMGVNWFLDNRIPRFNVAFKMEDWVPEPPAHLVETIRAERIAAERALFQGLMQEQMDSGINGVRADIDHRSTLIAQSAREVEVQTNHVRSLQAQLDAMLDRGDSLTPEQTEQEWERITSNVNVEKVEVSSTGPGNGQLIVRTKDLWLTNPDNGRRMPLGKFRVTLNFAAENITILNTTMRQGNRWDHPHVNEGGLCMGSYQQSIYQMLRRRELGNMVDMLFHILATVTPHDDWGRRVILWEEADDAHRAAMGLPHWSHGETEYPEENPQVEPLDERQAEGMEDEIEQQRREEEDNDHYEEGEY